MTPGWARQKYLKKLVCGGGYDIALNVQLSISLSTFSFPEQITDTHIVHTHLLWGVDVPFGDYDL